MRFFLYIDPGSGSIMLQMIIAGGLAVFLYFKRFYEKLKFLVKRVRDGKDE